MMFHTKSLYRVSILNTMFRYFVYNISLIMFCILCHSTVYFVLFEQSKYLISMTHAILLTLEFYFQLKQFRRSNHGKFLPTKNLDPFAKTSTGDTYVTTFLLIWVIGIIW